MSNYLEQQGMKKFEELRFKDLPKQLQENQQKMIPWQAVDIQTDYSNVYKALGKCMSTSEDENQFYQQKIEMLFSKDIKNQQVITGLSVRSLFDLFLQVRKYPKGSEIIMTGVNIPDMYSIIQEHGYIPVPLDLNIDTMEPIGVDALKQLITPKTKCIVFAYLFGIIFDIKPYIKVLKEHNIDIIEDAAESFKGPRVFNGTDGATLTMFSVGLIKIQTCFYGAIGVVRDDHSLYQTMKKIQNSYQLFTIKMFIKRAMIGLGLMTIMNSSWGNQLVFYLTSFSNNDREDYFVSFVRGFKGQKDFFQKYRYKPCAAMLSFIYDRMVTFNYHKFDLFNQRQQIAVEELTKAGILVPGNQIKQRGFWLFPIVVPSRLLFHEYLQHKGVNSFRGDAQIRYISPLEGYQHAPNSKWLMEQVIFLPLNNSINDFDFSKIIKSTIQAYNELINYFQNSNSIKPSKEKNQMLFDRAKL